MAEQVVQMRGYKGQDRHLQDILILAEGVMLE